ncbi:MAG: hypothetical protein ACKO9I_02195 [Sphaerospermopsis kisseleviana]|nr:hypothetical protein [Sphaerospermopsis sp. FACHB-1094]
MGYINLHQSPITSPQSPAYSTPYINLLLNCSRDGIKAFVL